MNGETIDGSWIVQNLLDEYPDILPVFRDWKLDCLGCSMSTFCTLREVADDYQLDLEQLLQEIRQAIV